MKKLLLILVLLMFIVTIQAKNGYEYHMTGSLVLSYTGYYALRALNVPHSAYFSVGMTLSTGLIKELTDANFSWADMGYNTAGSLIGICFAVQW